MERIRIVSHRSLSYAPQFLAQEMGYFRDAGLQVEFIAAPPGLALGTAVVDGLADVMLGSLWFPLRAAGKGSSLTAFAQANQQTRHVVLVRESEHKEAFSWSEFEGSTVLLPLEMPTPWIAFREILLKQRVDLNRVSTVFGLHPLEAVSEFLTGYGDYLIVDIETADRKGLTQVASLASALGPVPWSLYCRKHSELCQRPDQNAEFGRAIDRSLQWIAAAGIDDIAAVVSPHFPERTSSSVRRIIARYREVDAWPSDSTPSEKTADQWREVMIRWGLLASDAPDASRVIWDGPSPNGASST